TRIRLETIEIFECGAGNHFPGLGGTWEILNLIVEIEKECVGELAHLRETPLRSLCLIRRDHGSGHKTHTGDYRGGRRGPMTPNPFAYAVGSRVLARSYRLGAEMPPDILRELLHRPVAAFRLFTQCG